MLRTRRRNDELDDGTRQDAVVDRRDRRVVRPWAMVALVVGLASIAFGVWGLIRTGLNTDHIFTPTKDVLGVHQTPALALGEIGFGALLVIAASLPGIGRVLMAILGAASMAFGVIVLADGWTHRIDRWTAADDTSGWVALVTGAVLFLAALLLPTVRTRREPAPRTTPAAAASNDAVTRDDTVPRDDTVTRDDTVPRDDTVARDDTAVGAGRTPSTASSDRRHWWQPVHGHRADA